MAGKRMLNRVKVYIAKRTVNPLFVKGDIFVQCFDRPNAICPQNADGMGGSLDLDIMDKHRGWQKYFKIDNNTIDVKSTRYYRKVLEHLNEQKEALEGEIRTFEYYVERKKEKLNSINRFLMINGNEPNEI